MLINPYNFIEPEIPKLHPLSYEYVEYWREQKRRCIEGYWVGGRWMPPNLYFYLNFGTILLNKSKNSKFKSLGRSKPYDILWDFTNYWMEARGLIGFENQPEIKELEALYQKDFYTDEEEAAIISKLNIRNTLANTTVNLGKPKFYGEAKNMIWMANRGVGKDLDAESTIYYADHKGKIKDAKVGDQIYGANGKLTTIKSVTHYYDQLQYKVTLGDRREVICGKGHLWRVLSHNNYKIKDEVKTLEDIMKDYLETKRQDSKYYIPMAEPIEYSEKDLPINPYLLGVLIGDGCITKNIGITSDDPEIIEYLTPFIPEGNNITKEKSSKYQYRIGTNGSKINPLKDKLKELDLMGKYAYNKHIPNIYLYSSIEQRMELLRGLMDTDGSAYHQHGSVEYCTTSPYLADNIEDLLGSLGIRYKRSTKKTTHRDAYRFAIITSKPIFRLKRKLDRLNTNPSNYAIANREKVAIKKIEPLEVRHSVCIGVDNEDHCFLTDKYVVTHNSYSAANIVICHEFLFDGMKEYTDEAIKNPNSVEIMVGAEDAKYSGDLLKKTKLTLENLPGGFQVGETYYPSPFFKQYTGTWQPSKEIVHRYRKKIGGKWVDMGTGSSIKHRSYKDNPFASQGTRPSVAVKEEVGVFGNLIASVEADEETQKNGSVKFGSTLFTGTGGDMMGGGTLDIMKMFYDPLTYNCIAIPDIYENKGNIGFFTNAVYGKTDYKDKYGITNVEYALQKENEVREQKRKGTIEAYEAYIQYNPLVPSEMFLAKSTNIFPVVEAQNTLIALNQDNKWKENEKVVELYFDEKSPTGVNYRLDLNNTLKPITDFPLKDTNNLEGAVIIYEFPQEINGLIPDDMYIIGHDPVAKDEDGPSLNSIYVLKNKKYFSTHGHDEVVAEYIGRPSEGRHVVNEILEKLWMFYGSPPRGIFFENMVGNTKEYFEKRKKLSALCHQPRKVLSKKDSWNQSSVAVYGYPMNNQHIKRESEQYVRDWLIESRGKDDKEMNVLNIHNLKSRFLLQQIIHYSSDGNFDAVMGFMGCIIGLNETHNQYIQSIKEDKHPFDFLLKNKNLFNANV